MQKSKYFRISRTVLIIARNLSGWVTRKVIGNGLGAGRGGKKDTQKKNKKRQKTWTSSANVHTSYNLSGWVTRKVIGNGLGAGPCRARGPKKVPPSKRGKPKKATPAWSQNGKVQNLVENTKPGRAFFCVKRGCDQKWNRVQGRFDRYKASHCDSYSSIVKFVEGQTRIWWIKLILLNK